MVVSFNLLFLLVSVLLVLLIVCAYYLFKFAVILIRVEDSIEESLDVLDERYKRMNEILQTPIFFDSMEVRACVDEIKKSRDAILFVANKMTQKDQGDLFKLEMKDVESDLTDAQKDF